MNDINKNVDTLIESVSDLRQELEGFSQDLKGLTNAFYKLWRTEDMEENNKTFRWPFDEHGNLMENVSMSGGTDGEK